MNKTFLILFLLFFVASAQAQNYDEAKVPVYTLPDVLKTSENRSVDSKSQWEKTRRPEILALFENNVYGQMPKLYDKLEFSITKEDTAAMNGKAHLKEVEIKVWKNNKFITIQLVLFVPNGRRGPVPAFLLINNRERTNTDATRQIKSDFWPAEMLVDNGYAISAFHVSDLAPDDKDTYQNGVLRLYPEQLAAENGMKAIGAWAWGASRVLDYLTKDRDIDSKRVAVVGHSRGGKAALWAGAEDQRFALVFSNCSGNTGAALSRRKFGETVHVINDHFPHWFCNNYKKFNDNEDALPIDQHMLIALIAPRPVYVTSASEDLWADPKGSYLSLINAQKVFSLYGINRPLPAIPPAIGSAIIHSKLGYHNRKGIHNLTAFDWQQFISFAQFHYGRAANATASSIKSP